MITTRLPFDAHNGAWGVFTDIEYLSFGEVKSNSRDFTIGNVGLPANTSANLDSSLKGWVWTLAGQYRLPSPSPSLTLDLLAGTRMFDIHEQLQWNISGSLGPIDPAARSGSCKIGSAETAYASVVFYAQGGHRAQALQWAEKLQALSPNDPQVRQLVQDLGSRG